MKAGTLTDRITIQHLAAGGRDEYNQSLPEAWADLVKLWANVRHQSGSESIKAGADVSVVRASMRIRWRTGLDAGMRVLHLGAVYDIEAVLPGPVRQYIDLVCKRVN